MHPSPPNERGLYVQYGCGLCAAARWVNFDASPRLRLERVPGLRAVFSATVGHLFPANVMPGNIVRGLPVGQRAARGVYCSHVLEHLPREDIPAALRNTLKILMPGGMFRLVVPDLRWRAAQYLSSSDRGDSAAADTFVDACLFGTRAAPKGLVAFMRNYLGHSAHLWMYDFAALKTLLENAGFTGVRRCEFGDSNDPMFALVEDEQRFCDKGERELAIEAVNQHHINL